MVPSRRIRSVEKSKTLAITDKAKALARSGIDVVSLSAGEPDFDTPAHVKEAAIQGIKEGFTKYTASTGIPELRQAVADRLNREANADYAASNVLVTCGGKHAIFSAVLALCDPGDEVLIVSPHWVSYPEMAKLAGAVPRFVRVRKENGFHVEKEALREAISPKTKLLIFNNPTNPSGAVYDRQRLAELVEVLAGTNVYVVSDEIYGKIVYDGADYVSLASFPEIRDRVLVVDGVSKAYAMTGWRIGFLIASNPVAEAVAKVVGHSTSNATSVSQKAALAALTGDQSCVEEMREEFDRRRRYVCQRLAAIPEVSCQLPEGAFYVFPDVSAYLGRPDGPADSFELCDRLLESEHVAVVPGGAFGMEGHIRISYASSMEQLERGLDRIEAGLAALRRG